MKMKLQYDVLVIGTGAAGLSLALHIAPHAKVVVVSKGNASDGSTFYAQGGISAVLDKKDSLQSHIDDTLNAGAGLCHKTTVEKVVAQGKACVQELIDRGVEFTTQASGNGQIDYHLTREGGHSHRRVIHAADATGNVVGHSLMAQALQHPNITLLDNQIAVDLITSNKIGHSGNQCFGIYAFDRQHDKVNVIASRFTVLASGGACKAYLYTSNPDVSTGDGIAMGWRAGCRVANMEFIQFHPTCLYHPDAKSFLISEAVRGEGGYLLLPDGERFMERFDKRLELAPRDIVARAIDHEMKRLGIDCVYLDISHKSASFIQSYFPNIYKRCLSFGIDITQQCIPVVPAAHYTCGGIVADLNARTDIDNLYAVGEVAFTGLHGANRMASNSLLECLAFAKFAAKDIIDKLSTQHEFPPLPEWDESQVTDSDEEVVVSHNWEELRRFMWDYVGIVRTNKRLERAKRRIDLLKLEIDEYYRHFRVHHDLLELRNLVIVAELIVNCAMKRKESRGLHYTLDYPQPDNSKSPQDTILGNSQ